MLGVPSIVKRYNSARFVITKSLSAASKMRLAFAQGNRYVSRQQEMPVSEIRGGHIMKVWTKPAVREQEVGLEVTSYLPAEIDII